MYIQDGDFFDDEDEDDPACDHPDEYDAADWKYQCMKDDALTGDL